MSRFLGASRTAFRSHRRATTLALGSTSALALYYYNQQANRVLATEDSSVTGNVTEEALHPTLWTPPSRAEMIQALKGNKSLPRAKSEIDSAKYSGVAQAKSKTPDTDEYDLLIIGGGATGAGVALDAASRGLKVAVVDRNDWASGTSSKSTKLVHGGVRYLQKAIMELDYEQ